MPRMDNAPSSTQLIKMLLTGDGKSGKTHYAAAAAEEGFNVLYLDGDVAGPTLNKLSPAAKSRVYLLAAQDKITSGMRDSNFAETLWGLFNSVKFRWNDDANRIATRKDTEHTIWELQPAKLDHNCVLVIDSWTSFVESLMLKVAREHSVDLATATQSQMRPVYANSGTRATAVLQIIKSIPCHVIVIAHGDEYQHKVAPEGKTAAEVREGDMEIAWTKMIPKSTSKPHGLLLAKYFTDSPWLTISPSGRRMLDFKPSADRVGGGNFDGSKSTDEYSFANLVKFIGGRAPDAGAPVDSWLTIIPPGEAVEAPPKVLDSAGAQPMKGLAALSGFKKPPAQ